MPNNNYTAFYQSLDIVTCPGSCVQMVCGLDSVTCPGSCVQMARGIFQEHRVLRDESRLSSEYKLLEKAEQELFSALSNAVRTSHEKERAQAEKTKYWSIIGSAIGAFIGIVGTSINNWLRMRELRSIASSSAEVPVRLQEDVAVLASSVENQQNEVKKAMHSIEVS